ncbi:MAG: glycosyltransferase family 4 protein [Sphingorhabdus sp.]
MISSDSKIFSKARTAASASQVAMTKILDFPAHASTRIAMIGGFSPRRCGIATFTSDVRESVVKAFPTAVVDIYAMRSSSCAWDVSSEVRAVIDQDDPESYLLAARDIAQSGADLVWLQHEFGLFGGEAGANILALIETISAPLVVTLHTILEDPTPAQRAVMDKILARASRVVAMSDFGRDVLRRVYRAEDDQIVVIPHGVPDRPFGRSAMFKSGLGLEGQHVLMTFGLIGAGKGLEKAIAALPEIVAAHPNTVYCIVGATHPTLIAREGEKYRDGLIAQAEELGVADNVRWFNRFFEISELLDLIEAADIYITPYMSAVQATSGTLSYAVALGKAVVSTPYVHATELLADDHGVLVPFNDSAAIAGAVNALLNDPARLLALQQRAYACGRSMLWPEYATQTMAVAHSVKPPALPRAPLLRNRAPAPISFKGIARLSDDTGMLQHSCYAVPDRNHGYCIDDNARALMLMNYVGLQHADEADKLATIYAAFIQHAWNPDSRRFRNFMGFARNWLETEGSEDSNGRTLWALGSTVAEGRSLAIRGWAQILFDKSLDIALSFGSPRALAFATLGALRVLSTAPGHQVALDVVQHTVSVLKARLAVAQTSDWLWFESVLAYDNCRLPEALLRAGLYLKDTEATDCALQTLEWIAKQQTTSDGLFRPVGSETFGRELADALPFDQQPVEAWAAIDAADAAFDATGDQQWLRDADRAYQWFFGANNRGISIADSQTGTCRDGITARGVNENEGAESTLALHLADYRFRQLLAKATKSELRVSDVEAVNDISA